MGELSQVFGCHRQVISRMLHKQGVTLRNWRSRVGRPDEVTDLYESGQTAAQIAVALGVSATTVLNHLRAEGVELRPRGKVRRRPG